MLYCYICNAPMLRTVYVCNEHECNPQTSGAFHYILTGASGAFALGPRESPDAPTIDLTRFGIHADPDLLMDEGL